MWRDSSSDFRLFANDHALKSAWISETERAGNGRRGMRAAGEEEGGERWTQSVEIMAYFIYC